LDYLGGRLLNIANGDTEALNVAMQKKDTLT